jgi:hypothetical protein
MLTLRTSRARVFQVDSRCVASTFDIRRDLGPFVEHACGKEPPAEGRSEAYKELQDRVRGWMKPGMMDYGVSSDVIAYTE